MLLYFYFFPSSILFLLEEHWEPVLVLSLFHMPKISLSSAPAKPDLTVLPLKPSTSLLLGVPFVAVAFPLNFLVFIDMSIVELPGHMQLSFFGIQGKTNSCLHFCAPAAGEILSVM